MTTPHEEIMSKLHEMHTDLQVHVAKDEDQWRRIAEAEEEIKDLTRIATKNKTRTAVIAAVLAAGGSQALGLLKVLL